MRPSPTSACRALVAFTFLACVAAPSRADAQPQRDEIVATAQFEKGLADMKAGHFDRGCPALAESYRLDPRPGVLFTLAECEAQWGRVASAMAHYGDFLGLVERMSPDQQAKQRERAVIAKEQRAALADAAPKLTLSLPAKAPADLVVKRDGSELGRPSLDLALPVDPGEHVIVVLAPDGGKTEVTVTLAKGEKKTIELAIPSPVARAVVAPAPKEERPAAPPPSESRRSATGPLTWVAFGVGAVGLGVGGVTGALVLGKKSTIDGHCADVQCDSEGLKAADSAKTLGLVSTIGFAVGAVGVAAGVVLLVTGGSGRPTTRSGLAPVIAVSDRGGAAGLGGSF